jgi:Arc/MetJ-type ribon-helix-helix transcriptional regulator
MSKRVNLVLDDTVKDTLDALIPSGQRSEFVNATLKTQLTLLKRQRAAATLEALRRQGPPIPTQDVVRSLRQDRERNP